LIQDPLAVKILSGEFKEGDPIKVDAAGDELSFSRGAAMPAHDAYEERTIH
jgi:hypothetical protein